MNPEPPTDTAPRKRVLTRKDYQLIIGSFVLLAILVILLFLLISAFKQMMAVRWLSAPEDRTRLEIRQYVEILAQETSLERLDSLRTKPDGLPPLFAAMALAAKGEAGAARLHADAQAASGAGSTAAMAGLEYGRPGTLLPSLKTVADWDRWTAAVQAASLADIYSSVDFIREMDGHFIALFPGKKAIDPKVMANYQYGLIGLFTSADEPDALAAVLTFHGEQLRQHPELYKPNVLQKIQDSWTDFLKRTFEQRRAVHAGQEAVRAAVTGATKVPPAAMEVANRYLARRYHGNPVTLVPKPAPTTMPAGETLMRRDGGAPQALASSASGSRWASGGFDNSVRVWTAGQEDAPRVFAGSTFGVLAVAVSSDGARVASAGLDGTIRAWDAATGEQQFSVDAGTRRVSALVYSPDGQTLAAGGAGGSIRLLSASNGTEQRVLRRHVSEVTSLTFTPDGKRLVAGSLDRSLSVWDVADATDKPLVLDKHGAEVLSTAVAPDGTWLASGSGDRRVMLWTLKDKKPKSSVLKAHESAVTALAASPDGKWVASAGADHLLLVWDVATETVLAAHPTDVTINALRFTPDGQTLLMACDDGTLRRWNVSMRDDRPFSISDWVLWLTNKQ